MTSPETGEEFRRGPPMTMTFEATPELLAFLKQWSAGMRRRTAPPRQRRDTPEPRLAREGCREAPRQHGPRAKRVAVHRRRGRASPAPSPATPVRRRDRTLYAADRRFRVERRAPVSILRSLEDEYIIEHGDNEETVIYLGA